MRKPGIEYLSEIPWGTHISCLYNTDKDLTSLLVSYFRAGLQNNEFCLFIYSDQRAANESIQHLSGKIPGFQDYCSKEQVEFINYRDWYLKYSDLDENYLFASWIKKINEVLAKGFDGIRLFSDTAWLEKSFWKKFIDYERMVQKKFVDYNIIAICAYQLKNLNSLEILDIVNSHNFTFVVSQESINNKSNAITRYDRLNIISKMAASLAHEVRNPLTTVRGFLQLLQLKDDLREYKSYFELMMDELDRSNMIINEYLSLARDTDGNAEKFNINQLLKNLLPLLQAGALRHNKNVDLITGEVDDIIFCPSGLRQIVHNLIQNALDAMEPGKTVTIKTYNLKDHVVLEVKDQGKGIAKDMLNKIGMPFMTDKKHGSGLGLSICYNIAERYNASIDFTTGTSGTSFYVRFKPAKESNNCG